MTAMYPTTTHEIIQKVASIAENAELIGAAVTPAYVANMANCSQTHAGRMIQYWEGAGKPIGVDAVR